MNKPICKECENHKNFWGKPDPIKFYSVKDLGLSTYGGYWDIFGEWVAPYKQHEYRCGNGHLITTEDGPTGDEDKKQEDTDDTSTEDERDRVAEAEDWERSRENGLTD